MTSFVLNQDKCGINLWKRAQYLLILSILLIPLNLHAQKNHIKFKHLSIEQGLSHNSVYTIFQDSKGFMWFGTYVGLNKYDGYEFTVYKHDPENPKSLSHNAILSIYEDHLYTLWFGTAGGGLNRFDRATEQFTRYQHDPSDPQSLSNDFIWALYEDSVGELWIGTNDGLNRLDRATGKFIRYYHDPTDPQSLSHNGIYSIYEDRKGELWIGTKDGGLNKFNRTTGRFHSYQHHHNDPHSLSHDEVFAIYEDHTGTLWIGTRNGLNVFDRTSQQFIHYRHNPADPQSLSHNAIKAIYEDYAGRLWIGTHEHGVNRFHRDTETFTRYQHRPADPHSLNDNLIRSMYTDRSGVLWVGTKTGGLNTYDRITEQFLHYRHDPNDPQSLSHNVVYAIYQDRNGELWIGTRGGGLNRFNQKTHHTTHYQHDSSNPQSLSHNNVRAIYEDQKGNLWIGTDGGLSIFNRTTQHFHHYRHTPDDPQSLSHNTVYAIYEDQRGILWIGTLKGGVNRFDPELEQFTSYRHEPNNPQSLSHNSVYGILEDSKGELWIATRSGLNKLHPQTGQIIRYLYNPEDPQSLSNNTVRAIYEDRSGVLWFGTEGGLNKFHRERETFTHYREKDGLPNDVIYGILEDEQENLWLSTNQGISMFNPRTERFKNYDVSDGLQGHEFNSGAYYKSEDGEMFFGGFNGLNVFRPENITDNPYIPSVVLTKFYLFNKPVTIRDNELLQHVIDETRTLTLSYRENVFAFEFAVLNYVAPEKNKYAYKLEGFDKEWNEVNSTRRFAPYANLPAGEYVFRVKGANNDGIWNKKDTVLHITITPPWWKTVWFRLFIFAGLGSMFFLWHRMRMRTIKIQKKSLEIQVDERTKKLRHEVAVRKQTEEALKHAKETAETANRAKSDFLAHMSHELRTPLTAILGYTQIVSKDSGLTNKQRNALEIIHHSSEHLVMLIDESLDLSRIEAGKFELTPTEFYLSGMLRLVVEMVNIGAKQKGISFVYDNDPTLPTAVYGDEKRLRQILLNLLSNAIKFTPKGHVTFQVTNSRCQIPASSVPVNKQWPENYNSEYIARIRFQIEDTGIGIPKERLGEIFLAFHRVKTTEVQAEGIGLGLAISQRLARMMGSELHVQSTIGKGSLFWFDLELPEVIEATPEGEGKQQEIVGFKGGKRTILIVDDIDKNRNILREILTPLGFTIVEAVDGNDAINKAIQSLPDLILMDLFMRIVDGFEATKQIRQIPALQKVVVIAVSAGAYEPIRRKSLEAGCNDFISKPIRMDTLLGQLQKHLGLTWIYEDISETDSHTRSDSQSHPLIVPPEDVLLTLSELAKIGYLTGIEECTATIKNMDSRFIPFVSRVDELAENFQFDQILEFITGYINTSEG